VGGLDLPLGVGGRDGGGGQEQEDGEAHGESSVWVWGWQLFSFLRGYPLDASDAKNEVCKFVHSLGLRVNSCKQKS
jgi:hypothetical protein